MRGNQSRLCRALGRQFRSSFAANFLCCFAKSSCSQTRSTLQPIVFSVRFTSQSRLRFRAIFLRQYVRFEFGEVPCSGHPCQKQPSTKTASRCFRKTKSGLPTSFDPLRQPVIPFERRSEASRTSVDKFPHDRMADITTERFALEKMSDTGGNKIPFRRCCATGVK